MQSSHRKKEICVHAEFTQKERNLRPAFCPWVGLTSRSLHNLGMMFASKIYLCMKESKLCGQTFKEVSLGHVPPIFFKCLLNNSPSLKTKTKQPKPPPPQKKKKPTQNKPRHVNFVSGWTVLLLLLLCMQSWRPFFTFKICIIFSDVWNCSFTVVMKKNQTCDDTCVSFLLVPCNVPEKNAFALQFGEVMEVTKAVKLGWSLWDYLFLWKSTNKTKQSHLFFLFFSEHLSFSYPRATCLSIPINFVVLPVPSVIMSSLVFRVKEITMSVKI